ncbi:MAG: hypothetical protein LBQ57_09565 [Spirochaetales bacterium]|jgi:hypothetical protein|nr:hypothetical protein [Spirochaetales bacterium]
MILETHECIALYIFLKKREEKLSQELGRIMERCERCAYDNLSALELERLLEIPQNGGGPE